MNLASPVGRSNRTNTTYLKYKHNYYILVFVHRFKKKNQTSKNISENNHYAYYKYRATFCCLFNLYLETYSSQSNVHRTQIVTTRRLQLLFYTIIPLPDRSSVSSDHISFRRFGKGREVQMPLSATCRIKRFWASKNQSNIFVLFVPVEKYSMVSVLN